MEKDSDGFVPKAELVEQIKKHTGKSEATIYRWYKKIKEYWYEETIGSKTHIRLKEDNK